MRDTNTNELLEEMLCEVRYEIDGSIYKVEIKTNHKQGFKRIKGVIDDVFGVTTKTTKYGTWLASEEKKFFECSRCGEKIYSEDIADILAHHKYCGNCGAKMDKE